MVNWLFVLSTLATWIIGLTRERGCEISSLVSFDYLGAENTDSLEILKPGGRLFTLFSPGLSTRFSYRPGLPEIFDLFFFRYRRELTRRFCFLWRWRSPGTRLPAKSSAAALSKIRLRLYSFCMPKPTYCSPCCCLRKRETGCTRTNFVHLPKGIFNSLSLHHVYPRFTHQRHTRMGQPLPKSEPLPQFHEWFFPTRL